MKRTLSVILILCVLFSGCANVRVVTTETTADISLISENFTSEGSTSFAQESAADLSQTTQSQPQSTTAVITQTTTASVTASAVYTVAPGPTAATQSPTAARQSPVTQTSSATQSTTRTAPQNTTVIKTTAAPISTTAAPTKKQADSCTIRIECKTIQNNLKKLKAGKAAFVPTGGVILEDTEVELQSGDTAFTVLQRACKQHVCADNCKYCQNGGIQLEYTYTPGFDTYYVEGIHQIYEKDCGVMSGWMFSMNGTFPEVGASSIQVRNGDRIVFCYTCDMGDDVGNHFNG